MWAHTLWSGQLPAASASQRLHAAPRLPGSSGSPLEDRHLDLILRVMDHQSVGQGVLRERGEVGLGQQGLQSPEHLLLIG